MSKVKIAILETKIERLVEKQKELTERVRSNEKFIAGVGAVATLAVALLGFMGSAEANEWPSAGEMIQNIREHEAEKTRTDPDAAINNALAEMEIDNGSDDTPKQEELLQLPSDGDQQSTGRRHDRCHHRSWIRFIQERTGKNCWSRHSREENEEFGGKGTWVRCDQLVEGQTQSDNKGRR